MKVARVKVVLVDANWKVVKMRTAFEYKAQELCEGLVKANPGHLWRMDEEGDYIVYPAVSLGPAGAHFESPVLAPEVPPAGAGGGSARRRSTS